MAAPPRQLSSSYDDEETAIISHGYFLEASPPPPPLPNNGRYFLTDVAALEMDRQSFSPSSAEFRASILLEKLLS